jgi:hypothetical protein
MPIENPFSDDVVLGDVWEQGYLAGFAEPEEDHFRPFAPDLLDVYQQGEQAGRDDRRQLPPEGGGFEGQAEPSQLVEFAEEFGLHALIHGFFHMLSPSKELPSGFVEPGIGGLLGLVVLALEFSTDTPIQPLEPDWSGPVDQPEDTFLAMCFRTDHSVFLEGTVTDQGYWAGPGRGFYSEAVDDMHAHGHAEAFVARCSLPEDPSEARCGPVWPGQGQ